MAIDLLRAVATFQNVEDRENAIATFRTHVPWVAPQAYLHIVYKPAAPEVLSDAMTKLRFPTEVTEFLQTQNGAHLFSGALDVFGVVRRGQLLNRDEPFSLPPFNVDEENGAASQFDRYRYLAVGGYGFDGSTICIDRQDNHAYLFLRDTSTPLTSWPSLEDWLCGEIRRLSPLFDQTGRRLVSNAETIPPASWQASHQRTKRN